MTCIVGYVDKQNKNVIIGGDSAAVGNINIIIRKDKKVFSVGEFIFGCTSSFRMMQILRYSFTPPEVKTKDIYKYMCTDFVNEIRELFKENGYMQTYSGGDDKGGTFLVGYKNRLFKIEDDFQVGESTNGIDAVGCGNYYALGALTALSCNKTLTAKQKVIKSLEISTYYSGGVCKPYTIKTTKS